MKKILDKMFNSRIKSALITSDCSLITGQKRVGKSTLSSFACQYYNKLGYTCLSNYPIQNSLCIPMKQEFSKKDKKFYWMIDKDWLYDTDLRETAIFIDEGANYWPARGYSTDWTQRDTEFFTMCGKRKIKLFINVQYFDLIDLNVKRACDTIFFLTKNRWFKNLTNVDISELLTLPVANLNASITTRSQKYAYPVTYTVCQNPLFDCHFYRTPYYSYFNTDFDFKSYSDPRTPDTLSSWNSFFESDIEG